MKKTFLFLSLLLGCLTTSAQYLQRVAPEQVGMDSRRLMYADEAIQEEIANGTIPGAVLAVVKDGKMAYLKAYGNKRVLPNVEPMTTNTVFDMASCSKSMSTAICTMILLERGKIRLQDPVNLHIEGFKNWESEDGKRKKTIRIQDLLTHSSGLPAYVGANLMEEQYGVLNAKGLMEWIATCDRQFEPQTKFQYSCLNFITLQHIIEKVSGMSLREFARRNVFDVLGMNYTDYIPCKRDKDGNWVSTDEPSWAKLVEGDWRSIVAPTEQQENGQILWGQVHDPLARVMNGGISGNAAIFSNAEDIALLCAALQNGGEWNGHRILSPLGVQAMRTVPRAVTTLGRALGWDSYSPYASNNGDFFGPHTYSHTGYTGTSIVIDPDNDTSVILLTNHVHPKDEHGVVRLRSLVANAVATSILPQASFPKYTDHYYKRFVQFMDEPAITSEDIVMLGNSLTEGGRDWNARIDSKRKIVNRGIVGDDVQGVYDRLHQILPAQPAKLFLMIGVNDISHDLTADSIVSQIRKVVERIQLESPDTKLYLQSLLPFDESVGRYKRLTGKTDMVPQINIMLRALAKEKKLTYIDLFPLFCQKGTHVLRKELATDGLHLNDEGYAIWAKALKKYCK
ncbi:MAG: serine hydrolase [Bacteroides sp.]|nr:serine hydrolase [Bacteroides sp.]